MRDVIGYGGEIIGNYWNHWKALENFGYLEMIGFKVGDIQI